jgi:pimeloyl-ACP methyl ester carboxylesterase
METIVLVPGAWHGRWCWERVIPLLTAAGHRVATLELSGLGERRDVPAREVGLATHVDDVVDRLPEDERVVLVCHSYAGFVAGGVLARAPERIARLVLVDAFLPVTDDAMAHHIGAQADEYRDAAARDPDWAIPPPPLEVIGVTDPDDLAWAQPQVAPHPVRTWLEPVGPVDFTVVADRSYIACVPGAPPLATSRERAREQGFAVVELAAGHDAMITHPRELAALLSPSLS